MIKIWLVVSRAAATSHETKPINQPAKTALMVITHHECETMRCAMASNEEASATCDDVDTQTTNAEQAAPPIKFPANTTAHRRATLANVVFPSNSGKIA